MAVSVITIVDGLAFGMSLFNPLFFIFDLPNRVLLIGHTELFVNVSLSFFD